MEQLAYDSSTFEKIDYAGRVIKGTEFQSCTFKKCDFSNSIFSNNKFIDCQFEDCNLSMMKLTGSALSDAGFKNCKILGVIFSECQDLLFSVRFTSCMLDYASFMGKKMVKTSFKKSSLKEVNFTQTNLSGSLFEETDLSGAVFNGTDLSSANFVTAYNFVIDPELNNIKKAVFSAHSLPGLLAKYQIKII
jgi:fluoroquinolone resistance protein